MTNVPKERIFKGKVAKLNYLDWGPTSAGPLVMFHGGAWSWQEYLSLIPSLAQRWHVYAPDLRGNGRSEWVRDTYRLQDFAEDNAQFLRRLKGPAVLAGQSLGGIVALMLAERCADRVKAVILEDVPITLDNHHQIIESSREMFGVWLALKKRARSPHELALLLAQEYRDYPGLTSIWLLYFAECLWQLDPTFFSAMLSDFDRFTAGYNGGQKILQDLSCPVLCLRGEPKLGAVMTDEEISWLQKICNHVRCVKIGGVGHLLHLESQGQTQVLTAMLGFLGGLDAPPNGGSAGARSALVS